MIHSPFALMIVFFFKLSGLSALTVRRPPDRDSDALQILCKRLHF